MKIRNLAMAAVFALAASVMACDAGSVTGPQDESLSEPRARTACMAGGEVARSAGCPEDTWGNSDEEASLVDESLAPREKFPD